MHSFPTKFAAHRQRLGSVTVEMALVLPLVLLFILGLFEYGRYLMTLQLFNNAAREGARLGIVDPKDTAAITARVDAMTGGLDKTQLTISPSCEKAGGGAVSCAAAASGDSVIVTVGYRYKMIWPLAFGNQLNLSSTVKMRIE